MSSSMKWAVVGASTIAAEWMIPAIRSQGDEVVAVLSSSESRGLDYAGQHLIANAYTDLATLLAEQKPDAVYISTTNDLHRDQCIQAAQAGVHVLCEKPLALNLDDAVAMVRACEDAGVVMATNHHLRHAITHQALREQIASGAVGTPSAARVFHAVSLPEHLRGWRINKADAGGGVVLDITVHNADTLAFILGEYPLSVMAMTQNTGMGKGIEDGAMSVWRFPSGLLAYTHESFATPFADTGLEIHGDQGSLVAKGVMTQQPTGDVWLRNGEGRMRLPLDHHNLYEEGVSQFRQAICSGSHPAADGWAGVRSLAVALAVLASARSGKEEVVDYGAAAPG